METRRLGKSALEITKVEVGTAPIGSTPEWSVYWGPQDEDVAIKTIRTAIDVGVNWIDTAPFYGWGRAEQIVGKAIKGRRDQVHIFTKCGTISDGKGGWVENLKPESIRRELKQSLQRLQTDHVDLYQFHDPCGERDFPRSACNTGLDLLDGDHSPKASWQTILISTSWTRTTFEDVKPTPGPRIKLRSGKSDRLSGKSLMRITEQW